MLDAYGEEASPLSRLVELPGRGVTRVWECAGPPGAETVMLIHGVAFTAELNWGRVFAPLARHFRVVALDLRGHGDGIRSRSAFCLEDCADDVAALAAVLGIARFVAVGYSMGGLVAQLLHRRHPSLLSGLVLCSTASNGLGSSIEKLASAALQPVATVLQPVATAMRWNPFLRMISVEIPAMTLLGAVDDPATARWARAQLSRTKLDASLAAARSVWRFTSDSWIGLVDVPTAVVVTTRDRVVSPGRQLRLARTIPGASVHEVHADHGAAVTHPQLFTPALLEACWSVGPARAVPSPRPARAGRPPNRREGTTHPQPSRPGWRDARRSITA